MSDLVVRLIETAREHRDQFGDSYLYDLMDEAAAALSPSPERQTMTDEEAEAVYHDELAKLDMGVSNRAGKAAIAAIKRARSGEGK